MYLATIYIMVLATNLEESRPKKFMMPPVICLVEWMVIIPTIVQDTRLVGKVEITFTTLQDIRAEGWMEIIFSMVQAIRLAGRTD